MEVSISSSASSEEILHDVQYIKKLFFNCQKPQKQNDPVPEKTTELPAESDKPTRLPDPNGRQIYLREIGEFVIGEFLSVGSLHCRKSGRPRTTLQIRIDGEVSFLQGAHLQEAFCEKTIKPGDMIRVEKTRQYRKASERSHATASEFVVTKL